MANDDGAVYLVRAVETQVGPKPPGDAIRIDADSLGNVIFRTDPVPIKTDLLRESFARCISTAQQMVGKASEVAKDYRIESITLKLGLDSSVGCAFLVDAKVSAAIEVELKRTGSSSAG